MNEFVHMNPPLFYVLPWTISTVGDLQVHLVPICFLIDLYSIASIWGISILGGSHTAKSFPKLYKFMTLHLKPFCPSDHPYFFSPYP